MIAYLTYERLQGVLKLPVKYPQEFFARLRFDPGMGQFGNYSSIIRNLSTLEKVAASKDGKVVLAVRDSEVIVGYVACWYPEPGERWSKLGDLMYELAAIEVSRDFRRQGIARQMIASVLREDFFEDKIAFVSAFSWHWDLDGCGLSTWRYREMMTDLMLRHGFREQYTNEPNVAIKEENLFMARIGTRVTRSDETRFRNLRFGLSDL